MLELRSNWLYQYFIKICVVMTSLRCFFLIFFIFLLLCKGREVYGKMQSYTFTIYPPWIEPVMRMLTRRTASQTIALSEHWCRETSTASVNSMCMQSHKQARSASVDLVKQAQREISHTYIKSLKELHTLRLWLATAILYYMSFVVFVLSYILHIAMTPTERLFISLFGHFFRYQDIDATEPENLKDVSI